MRRRIFLSASLALPAFPLPALSDPRSAPSAPLRVVGPGPPPRGRGLRPSTLAMAPSHGVGPLLSSALYEGLTDFDASGEVVPALASSWESREAGAVWLFTVRPDVDAARVARYLSRLCSPASALRYSTWSLESVSLVERWHVLPSRVLAARLVLPLDTFPRLLATPIYRIPGAVAGVHGPCEVASVSGPDAPWVVSLKPRTEGRVLRSVGASSLVVASEPDPSARAEMVARGAADVALSVEGAAAQSLDGGVVVRCAPDLHPIVVFRSGPGLPPPSVLARLLDPFTLSSFLLRSVYRARGRLGDGSPPLRRPLPLPQPRVCAADASRSSLHRAALSSRALTLHVHSPDYLRLGRVLSLAWRAAGLDVSAALHRGPPASLWEHPLVLAPWAVREDMRLLLWGFSDPRRSGLPWSFALSASEFSALFSSRDPDAVHHTLRAVLDRFRCDAPAVVPVVPDRVDLWAAPRAEAASHPSFPGLFRCRPLPPP